MNELTTYARALAKIQIIAITVKISKDFLSPIARLNQSQYRSKYSNALKKARILNFPLC